MRAWWLVLMVFVVPGSASAQASPPLHLSDYVGTYSDAPGHTLEIVDGDGLFAVLDEAKYPLRASAVDQFTTITGQTIPFLRDAHGKVTGYQQDGKFHPRVSSTVTPEAAALAYPRPKGQDLGLSLSSARLICTTALPWETLRNPAWEKPRRMRSCAASSMALTKMCTAFCSTSMEGW